MSSPFDDHMRAVSAVDTRAKRPARVAHCNEQGLHAAIIRREHVREFHITVEPLPGESVDTLVWRLHSLIVANHATMVRQEVFGSRGFYSELLRATAAAFRRLDWPITWIEGLPCENTQISGIHAFAIAGPEVQTLYADCAVGTVFSDGFARHCLLGAISPKDRTLSRAKQAAQVFHQINQHLHEADMHMTDLARTWLFLDKILEWYGEFNTVRHDVFEHQDLFSHCMPASTGIGARNLLNSALIAGAWAVQPLDPQVQVRPVTSPLQCSARDYGSCFSRAVEIIAPDVRHLLVSGTASIAPGGATEHNGNIQRQVALTMEVVQEILRVRKMDWSNVTRGTAYLKRAEDAWAFAEYEVEHELKLPILVTEADICRDELLFEIEVDAIVPNRVSETVN